MATIDIDSPLTYTDYGLKCNLARLKMVNYDCWYIILKLVWDRYEFMLRAEELWDIRLKMYICENEFLMANRYGSDAQVIYWDETFTNTRLDFFQDYCDLIDDFGFPLAFWARTYGEYEDRHSVNKDYPEY